MPGPWAIKGKNDKELGDIARRLNVERRSNKGVDIVARATSGIPVVGEAKRLCGSGGGQDKSIDEVMGFIEYQTPGALRIGVVDGSIWPRYASGQGGSERMRHVYQQASGRGNVVLSALLLPHFLRNI